MNITLIDTLPRANSISPTYATIAKFDGSNAWQFLLMPQELRFSKNVQYQSSSSNSFLNLLQYSSTTGNSLSCNVPLYSYDRDLTKYIEGLTQLCNPSPNVPPVLIWQWGQRILSPCVMTKCDRTEFDWFSDGRIKGCNISIELIEVNPKQLVI